MINSLFFLGRWRGVGSVIEKPVKYLEEASFEIFRTQPATVIAYNHKTWADEEKTKPMHYESGVIKIFPQREGESFQRAEANYAHPFSLNTFEEGRLENGVLTLETSKPEHLQRGPSARGKQTTGFKREYRLNEQGELEYKMYLAVDGGDLFFHLQNKLKKE